MDEEEKEEMEPEDYDPGYSILHRDMDGEPILGDPVLATLLWGYLMDSPERQLAKTHLRYRRRWYYVSTIWTGFDYGFGSTMFPVMWETMIFPKSKKGDEDLWQDRYASIPSAYKGHRKAVQRLRSGDIDMYARSRKHKLLWKALFRPHALRGHKSRKLSYYKYRRRR